MWLVRYSPTPEEQGQALGFVARASLPTDDDCRQMFDALEATGHHQWALAMALKHRSGVRWGELIALRPVDLGFDGNRVVRIHRAVEQSRHGLAIKSTKNRQRRVSTSRPASPRSCERGRNRRQRSVGSTVYCSRAPTAASQTGGPSSGSGPGRRTRPAGR